MAHSSIFCKLKTLRKSQKKGLDQTHPSSVIKSLPQGFACEQHRYVKDEKYVNKSKKQDLRENGVIFFRSRMHTCAYSIMRLAIICACTFSEPPERATREQIATMSGVKTLSESPSVCTRNLRHIIQ